MIPSRERIDDLCKAIQSMIDTSTEATAIVYCDIDQENHYWPALQAIGASLDHFDRGKAVRRVQGESPRIICHVAPQQGPIASSNHIYSYYREGYTVFGMIPDDSEFKTPGWDRYLLDNMDGFRNRIGVVAAAHNGGDYVNFPWVSREWIDTVGWYFLPTNFHHCADSAIEILGECAGAILYAPPDKFTMHHQLRHTFNRDKFEVDAQGFLFWCVGDRRAVVSRIKDAIGCPTS